jgi:hypothetical protein
MPFANALPTSNPVVIGLVVFVIATLMLYFARLPAHRAILSLSRALSRGLRLSSIAIMKGQAKLELRNREVLLEAGREAKERMIEREFERVEAAVRRDLSECPGIERDMKVILSKVEEDHKESSEVPPEPPGWTKAVSAVADLQSKSDGSVGNILEQIHGSLVKSQDKAIEAYRKSINERHAHLKAMMPAWRQLEQKAGDMQRHVVKLLERSKDVDRHMEDYTQIVKKTDKAVRMLSTSATHQFLTSLLILLVAIGGAVINFSLIARPMAEMVGGNSMLGPFKTSDIAALVIILVELSIGIFMMESLRITRLFPIIGALPDKLRVRMIWITFTILFSLACVEAGLAYMREILLHDELATNAVLRGAEGGFSMQFAWITTISQMGMGFILPFALVFAAIPLENFIFALRAVSGMLMSALLRTIAVLLRAIASVFRHGGEFFVHVYDMLIFAPLWIEQRKKAPGSSGSSSGSGRSSSGGGGFGGFKFKKPAAPAPAAAPSFDPTIKGATP